MEKEKFTFDPNSTENQGRWRLIDPKKFTKMWTEKDKKTDGISYIVGILENGKKGTQAVRFQKSSWDEHSAPKWWEKNKDRFVKTWTTEDWEKWKFKFKFKPKPKTFTRRKGLCLARKIITRLDVEYVNPKEVTIDYKWKKNIGIPVGSLRRGADFIGDIDIILTKKISVKDIEKLNIPGLTDLSGGEKWIKFKYDVNGQSIGVDIFIFLHTRSWGAALIHSTGPVQYNTRIRKKIKTEKWEKTDHMGEGWILSQNGLFKNDKMITTYTERDLQKFLNVRERNPENR